MFRLGSVLLLLALGGCATLIEGTSQDVAVVTEPAGAKCIMDRQARLVASIDQTPGTAHLDKSSSDLLITCSKDGFQPVTVTDGAHFVATTFGNVLAGGVIGIVVDAASGADSAYQPEVHLALDPTAGGTAAGAAWWRPLCPIAGVQASRSNGTLVSFKGPDPSDPDICLQETQKETQRLYFAIAPVNAPNSGARRDALKAVFTRQAGAAAGYESDAASGHWTHELRLADPEIVVIDHKIIRADRLIDHRRNAATQVEGDAILWIDPTNGMPLKLTWHQTAGDPATQDKTDVAGWDTVYLKRE